MRLSRRGFMLAAAAAPVAQAAEPTTVVCPLVGAPKILVPGVSDAFGTRLVGGKIYRGLMRWDAEGVLRPDLAKAVEVSPDGLTHVFHLRQDVSWHDSGGFSADDVAFSVAKFHRVLQPRLSLDRVTVGTPDPWTVVLSLPAPDGGFLASLDALSLPVVPEHIHNRPGWALDPVQVPPVGTGPFRVERWLRLVRFEWFAGPKPGLGAIDCPILPDAAARLALAESGTALLLAGDAVDLAAVPRLRSMPALAVDAEYPAGARSIAGLRLNPAAAPLNQPEVRSALAAAINRQAALREGWAGLGRVATGPVVGRSDGAALPEYSPRAASSALTAAGLRPDDAGIRATLTYLHPGEPPWQALFPMLRASLAQVGVELVAEAVSGVEWARRVEAGGYQVTGVSVAQTGRPAVDLARGGEMAVIWLAEPGVPVVRDRRLKLPGGVLGSFAEAAFA